MGEKYKMLHVPKQTLEQMYFEQNMTMQKIAIVFGVSASAILYRFKKYGIPSKKLSDYPRPPMSDEEKARISCLHKGKTMSSESRHKLSDSKKIHTDGHKKMSKD